MPPPELQRDAVYAIALAARGLLSDIPLRTSVTSSVVAALLRGEMKGIWIILLGCFLGLTGCMTSNASTNKNAVWLKGWDSFRDFQFSTLPDGGGLVFTSPETEAPFAWDELVVSWNVEAPAGSVVRVEARAIDGTNSTRFYKIADWTPDNVAEPRRSPRREQDDHAVLKTDTLVLKAPARAAQVRLTLVNGVTGGATLKYVTLSFRRSGEFAADPGISADVKGKSLEVPEKSQIAYPGGAGWCSPTSVSMVLNYWSGKLGRTDLAKDVPEVAQSVFDENYNGTGNWPFNAAYAGAFPGMRACITRFDGFADLEAWLRKGLPVVISAPANLLNDNPKTSAAGHLVVFTGFTENGDVVINDPWARLEKGQRVHRVYPREDVRKAWSKSGRTVYLIYPVGSELPPGGEGKWR